MLAVVAGTLDRNLREPCWYHGEYKKIIFGVKLLISGYRTTSTVAQYTPSGP